MDINYSGVVNVAEAALPPMLERGERDFINFASGRLAPHPLHGGLRCVEVCCGRVLGNSLPREPQSGRALCLRVPAPDAPLLNQARDTVWPKFFDQLSTLNRIRFSMPSNSPRSRRILRLPREGTRLVPRRWLPNLIWRRIHAAEGTP